MSDHEFMAPDWHRLTLWYMNCYHKQNDMIDEQYFTWHEFQSKAKGIHHESDKKSRHTVDDNDSDKVQKCFSCSSESPWNNHLMNSLLRRTIPSPHKTWIWVLELEAMKLVSARRSSCRMFLPVFSVQRPIFLRLSAADQYKVVTSYARNVTLLLAGNCYL